MLSLSLGTAGGITDCQNMCAKLSANPAACSAECTAVYAPAATATSPTFMCSDGSITLDPTLASCPAPWWQQWYVIVPVLGLVGFAFYKHKKATPATLSGHKRR